jgi:hypothetical protein
MSVARNYPLRWVWLEALWPLLNKPKLAEVQGRFYLWKLLAYYQKIPNNKQGRTSSPQSLKIRKFVLMTTTPSDHSAPS